MISRISRHIQINKERTSLCEASIATTLHSLIEVQFFTRHTDAAPGRIMGKGEVSNEHRKHIYPSWLWDGESVSLRFSRSACFRQAGVRSRGSGAGRVREGFPR